MRNTLKFENRLGQRLTLLEMFSLSLCVALTFVFAWYQSQGDAYAYDFTTYLWAGRGDLQVHYYAYWILPFFRLLTAVSPITAFILWNLANIAGLFFATRVLGGGEKAALALLTYQMFYTLYYGNIIGILLGGLALCWWGMSHRRWYLAGFGLLVALTKYQLGLSFGLILLFMADISWRERFQVLLVPCLVLVASLIVYPGWPVDSWQTIVGNPPNSLGNISLWQWVGPFATLLWLPPLVLPLTPGRRLTALVAAATLALPYFQQSDLLALFILPVGWLPLAGNLGFYLYLNNAWADLWVLAIIPLGLYLWLLLPPGIAWARRKVWG